jgi:hypothetical protein
VWLSLLDNYNEVYRPVCGLLEVIAGMLCVAITAR